jgi:tetratricopeptide (TPR) repeat protein
MLALERLNEAEAAGLPAKEALALLQEAADFYSQALDLIPEDAVDDLAVTHNQLGQIYARGGDVERALPHFQASIRHHEIQGKFAKTADVKFNTALALTSAGRLADALDYANAALRDYGTYGDRTAAEAAKTRWLIEKIQRALQTHAQRA